MSRGVAALLLVLALALDAHGQDRSSAPQHDLSPDAIASELKKGGYVLYFRHAATDFSQNDSKSGGPEDCANQRNLSARGRAEARAIGEAMKTLGIAVARAVASPMCRTVETARLVFGKAEPSPEVRGGPMSSGDSARYEPLRRLMSRPPPAGTNVGIASHGNPFYALAGPPYLAEGELAVIKPQGENFEIVARLRPEDWTRLLSAQRRQP